MGAGTGNSPLKLGERAILVGVHQFVGPGGQISHNGITQLSHKCCNSGSYLGLAE